MAQGQGQAPVYLTGPVGGGAGDRGGSQVSGSGIKQSLPILTSADVNLCVSMCSHLGNYAQEPHSSIENGQACVCEREREGGGRFPIHFSMGLVLCCELGI